MKRSQNKEPGSDGVESPAAGHRSGFAPNQLRKLTRPLGQQHIHVREIEGRPLSYIEGWYAISQANEIFGYGGWDRETVSLERTLECVKSDITTCGYVARVRVRVRTGSCHIVREGTGWGFAASRTIEGAHERALKAAETDATKRALSTFGGQFGLNLYDKERASNRKGCKFVLFAPDGQPLADNLSPEAFATGLRQLIEKCQQPGQISALMVWNNGSLNGLRNNVPDLRNSRGLHFTDLLLRLAERAIRRLEAASEQQPVNLGPGVDALPPPRPSVAREAVADREMPNSLHDVLAAISVGPISIGVGFSAGGSNDPRGELPPPPNDPDIAAPAHAPSTSSDLQPNEDQASKIGVGERIDKSVLSIGFERRVRSKLHLKKVAQLPCLICSRQPSHAHHVKFAQRRGMSQKVSDEFVVPLCAIHHGDLHRAVCEREWWQKQGHDPLAIAAGLWDRFGRNLH